jgi:hypothetical protein
MRLHGAEQLHDKAQRAPVAIKCAVACSMMCFSDSKPLRGDPHLAPAPRPLLAIRLTPLGSALAPQLENPMSATLVQFGQLEHHVLSDWMAGSLGPITGQPIQGQTPDRIRICQSHYDLRAARTFP